MPDENVVKDYASSIEAEQSIGSMIMNRAIIQHRKYCMVMILQSSVRVILMLWLRCIMRAKW